MKSRRSRINRQIVGNLKVKEQNLRLRICIIELNPKTENSYRILRVPKKLVMREVKHRQQLIDKRKADMEAYKDYDYVSCQNEPRCINGNESGTYESVTKWIAKYHRTWTQTYVCDHFN